LDPALLDRFLFLEVESHTPTWLKYASAIDLNQIIIDFIKEYPDKLFWQPKDGGIGATPRSWEKLASFVDNIDSIPKEIQYDIFKGKIGSELAGQFVIFINEYANVIKLEDIEDLVKTERDNCETIEELGTLVNKLMQNQEAIQKNYMADQIMKKYINKDAKSSTVMMAFLYGLDLEILAGYIKSYQETNPKEYSKLVQIDKELNNKNLFKRIIKELQRL
jgi:hypothetical protein